MTALLVTVTGRYVLADDTPAAGTVLLTPVVVAGMSADTKRLVTRHSVAARLDGDGSFEVGVLASDDPDWMVSGPVLYEVAEYIAGARGKAYQVHIPGPGPVDLADLQPVDEPQTVAPFPVPGPVGPANSLTVGTVTTLPPGSDATAAITGTPPTQVLDLGLPKGMTGNPQDTALGDLTDVDTSRDATGMVVTRQSDGTYKGAHVRVGLNQLTDVTAPANTPPNSLLGTVGEGATAGQAEWEPLHLDYVQQQVLGPLPSTVADLGQRVTELEHTGEIVPPDYALTVDLYSGSFTRIIGADQVPASPAKRITVSLATTPGPNGAIFASLADISGTSAVWADFAGTIGKAVDSSGTGINGASLKEAIRRGQIITVHRGTDGTHPTLVVEKVEDPADAGSSLTLDALKDVSAPASTPAGMFLGTTAVGAWGAVANPTAGVWAGKTRTSRPNSTDRLVEVWDGAAWIPIHYNSGVRDITATVVNPLQGPAGWVQRTGDMVTLHLGLVDVVSGEVVVTLPLGFRPPLDMYLPRLYNGQPAIAFASGEVRVYQAGQTWLYATFPAVQQLPTSLPGTLITTAP